MSGQNRKQADITLSQLQKMMANLGVQRILVKSLARNDNSKNQPYVAKDEYSALNILPVGEISTGLSERGNAIVKATMSFLWLQSDGQAFVAPHTKLILYPQYPEMRLSGFLKGAKNAPSEIMNTRSEGRILFLGITNDRRTIAWVTTAETSISREFNSLKELEQLGVFQILPVALSDAVTNKTRLLTELRRIHQLEWIDSKALNADGSIVACNAPQCVGYTLEAELGIARNGRSEPDFLGWEVKAGVVSSFERPPTAKSITLMTPSPTDGFYGENGVEAFIRKYGYLDKRGREDRINFGGIFRFRSRHDGTGLTLNIDGYDEIRNIITNPSGSVHLIDDRGEVAAAWSFRRLMEIWTQKHALAAYVPALVREQPQRQYSYGQNVRIAEGTDFKRLIAAIATGVVYVDPGIKMELASTAKPKIKNRSQFRVNSSQLAKLYASMTTVNLQANESNLREHPNT
jgi:MvaI/BcnI restriction endonuclease family